jgi:hypothetical protein
LDIHPEVGIVMNYDYNAKLYETKRKLRITEIWFGIFALLLGFNVGIAILAGTPILFFPVPFWVFLGIRNFIYLMRFRSFVRYLENPDDR